MHIHVVFFKETFTLRAHGCIYSKSLISAGPVSHTTTHAQTETDDIHVVRSTRQPWALLNHVTWPASVSSPGSNASSWLHAQSSTLFNLLFASPDICKICLTTTRMSSGKCCKLTPDIKMTPMSTPPESAALASSSRYLSRFPSRLASIPPAWPARRPPPW